MKVTRRDIAVIVASTLVIQTGWYGYWGYKSGAFDAYAKETVPSLKELRKEKLNIWETKYLFDFGAAEQKEPEEMYVIEGTPGTDGLIKSKRGSDGPDDLFVYRTPDNEPVAATTKVEPEATGATKALSTATTEHCNSKFVIHHFKKGSSKLNRMVVDTLKQITPQVAGKKVTVEGFTCPLGRKKFNDRLAISRAKTVAGFLEKEGVEVVEVKGKGKDKYISTDEKVNRRVEINSN